MYPPTLGIDGTLTVRDTSDRGSSRTVFQAVSGVVLMTLHGWPLTSPWAIAVWALFIFTGACWLPVVWIQILQSREAQSAASLDALSEAFHRRFRVWFALGVAAFAAVMAIYWLMVAKPMQVT